MLNFTNIIVLEGKNFTLHCNVQEEPVIWKINGVALNELTKWNENFQSAPNSTLLINNPAQSETSGVFNVTCNVTNATDGKNYRVYLRKGINLCVLILNNIFIICEKENISVFTYNYVNTSGSLGEREMCGNTSPKSERFHTVSSFQNFTSVHT